MRLDRTDALIRFDASRRCVLTTLHPQRGADSVPTVHARRDDLIFLPVDDAKPKSTTRLQRLRNIEFDERVVLLADGWDEDWRDLWWVRIHGRASVASAETVASFAGPLCDRYPQYSPTDIVGGIAVEVVSVTGWAASA